MTPRAVGNACLCLAVRKAARVVSRRYDDAFRGLGITSGQFSILMAISAERPVGAVRLAEELGMDRTTLTAAIKPLVRDALVVTSSDPEDGRSRRFRLTDQGRAVLGAALPLWQRVQHDLAHQVGLDDFERLRTDLRALA